MEKNEVVFCSGGVCLRNKKGEGRIGNIRGGEQKKLMQPPLWGRGWKEDVLSETSTGKEVVVGKFS